jgi:hypothetical protein
MASMGGWFRERTCQVPDGFPLMQAINWLDKGPTHVRYLQIDTGTSEGMTTPTTGL